MKEHKISLIINEYYHIISPLLMFAPCERIDETERQVLSFLCAVNGCGDGMDACWSMIEGARCLQSVADGALLLTAEQDTQSVAYDIKMGILSARKISKVRNFNEGIFVEELKNGAAIGEKSACKLLAILQWLGWMVPQNKTAARNIWSVLAVSGSRIALDMLIYGCADMGDETEQIKWSHIRDILQSAFESFSAIAVCAEHTAYTAEEVEMANLILFIMQKHSANDEGIINRPMLHYVLHSKADYRTKMDRVSQDTNYFLAMYDEDKTVKRSYGFNV